MIDKLLFAVDATDASQRAVQVGAELAHGTDAEVAVFHARRTDVSRNGVRHIETTADARQFVDEVADKLVANGLRVQQRLMSSSFAHPAEAILATADEVGASMIVVGTRGGNPVVQGLLGNVACKVVGESGVPVLTVPSRRQITPFGKPAVHPDATAQGEAYESSPDRIVVVAEDSDAGRRTLSLATEVAHDLSAEVVVLHARIVQPSRGGSWSSETHGQAVRFVEAAAAGFNRRGIGVAEQFVVTVQGDPAEEFIKLSTAAGASLIMVPNRQRPRLAEALVPNTAHRLIGRSPIPVVSVP